MTFGSSENERKLYRKNLVEKSALIWLVLIGAEIIHGILRAIVLAPLVGEFRSNQIGVFTGAAIIVAIVYLTIRWIGAAQRSEQLAVGASWLVVTVAFEVLFGRFVVGLSWERIGSDYDLLNSKLMPVGLLVLLFSPMVASKLRRVRESS